MNEREREVLNMQLTLIPILSKAWNCSYSALAEIFKKYDVLSYIDLCYDSYNSTGNQGIYSDDICNEVIRALKPENLPKQYFFGTERALTTLSFDRVRRQIIQ